MVAHSERGEHMSPEERAKVKAWHTRLHSDFNNGWLDIDQLKLITTDAGEEPERIQAALELLDELQKKGEA